MKYAENCTFIEEILSKCSIPHTDCLKEFQVWALIMLSEIESYIKHSNSIDM